MINLSAKRHCLDALYGLITALLIAIIVVSAQVVFMLERMV